MEKIPETQTPQAALLILNENLHDLDRRVLFLEDLIFSLVKKAEQENAVNLFDEIEIEPVDDALEEQTQEDKPKEQECENTES